jgi:hypothetical protein
MLQTWHPSQAFHRQPDHFLNRLWIIARSSGVCTIPRDHCQHRQSGGCCREGDGSSKSAARSPGCCRGSRGCRPGSAARATPAPGWQLTLGYYSFGGYCLPSANGNTRGAIEMTGNSCPLDFYASGNDCVSSTSSKREAIPNTGQSCPRGGYSSGNYCLKSR